MRRCRRIERHRMVASSLRRLDIQNIFLIADTALSLSPQDDDDEVTVRRSILSSMLPFLSCLDHACAVAECDRSAPPFALVGSHDAPERIRSWDVSES